jgi:hypothetical protein
MRAPDAGVSLCHRDKKERSMDCTFIGWCSLKPEAQAAWVQAVFSVLAIGVAIAVPWWAERVRRKEKQKADRDAADILLVKTKRHVEDWLNRARRAVEIINGGNNNHSLADGLENIYVADEFTENVLPHIRILGDAGDHLRKAFVLAGRIRQGAPRLRNPDFFSMSNEATEELKNNCLRWLALLQGELEAAESGVNARMDELTN